jgi:predicted metalloprotease
MTANESPASSSLNTNTIAQQADAALNAVGDKVSDLTGQHEAVNKGTMLIGSLTSGILLMIIVVTGLQENVLGTQREQPNENQNQNQDGSTSVAKEDISNQQVEEFLRHQYRSYKA